MAVLVEAISVIVRRDAIDRLYDGGWLGFISHVPNATLCTDGQLARVGFMDPKEVKTFVDHLQSEGLEFLTRGACVDIAIVDQQKGLTMPCEWLEFARLPMDQTDGHVGACWLFEGSRIAAGIHLPGKSFEFATPDGWKYEGSLSERFVLVPDDDFDERFEFLRTEQGIDVFRDTTTGKELFKPRIENKIPPNRTH